MKKKSVSKTSHNTTVVETISNARTWREMIMNDSFMQQTDDIEWRRRLCNSLYLWHEKPDSIELLQFLREYKIPRQTFYDWVDKYPDVKKTYEEVRLYLGMKRRIGAMTKLYDKDMTLRDMHLYDPEWHQVNKYHADLKREEAIQSGIVVVEIPAQVSTGKVPPLLKTFKETAGDIKDEHQNETSE